jgi:hypothetical protein
MYEANNRLCRIVVQIERYANYSICYDLKLLNYAYDAGEPLGARAERGASKEKFNWKLENPEKGESSGGCWRGKSIRSVQ